MIPYPFCFFPLVVFGSGIKTAVFHGKILHSYLPDLNYFIKKQGGE
jgi:hypothetical protein